MEEVNKPESANSETMQDEILRERVLAALNVKDEPSAQTVQTKTEGSADVAVQDASSTTEDADTSALKLIEASTGRKFATVDEAQKFLSNLNKLVGDQEVAKGRKAAELLDKWAQHTGKDYNDVMHLLADSLVTTSAKQEPKNEPVKFASQESQVDGEVLKQLAQLEDFKQRSILERKYPEAVEVQEEIAVIAKAKGVSYVEAFEQSPFKSLLALKKEEEAKRSPIVTPSNRTNIDTNKVTDLGKKIASGRASEEDQQKFIEALGLLD